MEKTFEMVSDADITDFVVARKENVMHFNAFVKTYKGRGMNKLMEM